MATLGLIGSGNIGSTLARQAVDAGLDVVLSNSRGPATLSDLVGELGPQARAGTPTQAAAAGDWVVMAIPYSAIGAVPKEPLAGKTVIDTGNYWARVTVLSLNSTRRSSPTAKYSSATWPRRMS